MNQQVDDNYDQFSTTTQSTPPPSEGAFFQSQHQQYMNRPVTPLPGPQQQNYISPVPTSMQFSFPQPPTSTWSTSLCHCCDDPSICLITSVCPCITFSQIAEIVDQGETSYTINQLVYSLLVFTCLPGLYSYLTRSKLRGKYNLEESPTPDCLVHCCCEQCALCQEYRQLKFLGFDMGIGWDANMERHRRIVSIGIPQPQSMIR